MEYLKFGFGAILLWGLYIASWQFIDWARVKPKKAFMALILPIIFLDTYAIFHRQLIPFLIGLNLLFLILMGLYFLMLKYHTEKFIWFRIIATITLVLYVFAFILVFFVSLGTLI